MNPRVLYPLLTSVLIFCFFGGGGERRGGGGGGPPDFFIGRHPSEGVAGPKVVAASSCARAISVPATE